jgi:hypothetical protein
LTQSGGAGGLNASLAYDYRTAKTQFYVNGTGTLQDYVQGHSLTAASYGTNASVTTMIGPKLKLDARSSAAYSPFYSVLPFTGSSAISLGAAPSLASSFAPGFAFASTSERNVNLDDYVGVTDNLSKSSSFSLSATWHEFKFLDDPALSLQTYGGRAEFHHRLTKALGFHLAYGRDIPRYSSGVTSGIRFDTIDAGLDYGDSLTFARRWSLAFNTSTAAVRLNNQTHFRLNGSATLGRGIGRSWTTGIGYARGTEFYAGFQQPLLFDSVNVWLRGQLSRQLQWSSGGLFSRSTVGFGGSGGFTQSAASTQLTLALSRSLGLYGQYAYYYSQVPQGASSLQWASILTRHTGTVGVTTWLPIFNEKRPSGDSR